MNTDNPRVNQITGIDANDGEFFWVPTLNIRNELFYFTIVKIYNKALSGRWL